MVAAGLAWLIAAGLGAAGAASAEPAPSWPLTLAECIDRALRENVGLNVQRREPQVAAQEIESAASRFDVRLDASGSVSETRSPTATSELDGSQQPTTERQGWEANLAKRLDWGTELRVGGSVDEFRTDSSFSTLNPAIDARVDAEVRQPLLKGAGRVVNRAALAKAEIAVDHADQGLRAAALDVVRDVELAYWALALARERLRVAEAAVGSSQSLLVETRAKQEQGVKTPVDVLQARADLAAKQEAVLVARQDIADGQDRLLALLDAFDEAAGRTVVVEPLPDRPPEVPEVRTVYQRALALRPEYRQLRHAVRSDEVDVAVARRQRRPTLDLSGRGGYSGRDDAFRGAYRGLRDRDGHQWQVDVVFEMPWGLRAERAELRRAELRRLQGDLDLVEAEVALRRDVRIGCRAVATGWERVQANRTSLALQEKQFAQERARYEAGLVTIRDTLIAQDNLNEARLRVLVALRDTIEAVVRLARLDGSLLRVHGIDWKTARTP